VQGKITQENNHRPQIFSLLPQVCQYFLSIHANLHKHENNEYKIKRIAKQGD
jgi:hypothetical protein